MNRYTITILLFAVIFVTGYFGQHFGYVVNGVPMGSSPAKYADGKSWSDSDYGLDVAISYWQQKANDNALLGAIAYIWYFTSFQIQGVPVWLSAAVDLMVILALLVLWALVRGE